MSLMLSLAAPSTWERVIVHADMDAFFAAVEELDNPSLRNHPVAIGGDGPRSVVATANYVAREFGIHSAMPMAIAKRRCRNLCIVPPRMERYKAISKKIMNCLESFSRPIEPLSLDEAFLDASEIRDHFEGPEALGRAIKRAVFEVTAGLRVSVGIGTTKFVAKLASDQMKPDGLTVIEPTRTRYFLAPLGVEKLWGVGPKTSEKLRSLGFFTLADLALASDEKLACLGTQGRHLRNLSLGIDNRQVRSPGQPKSLGWERTLDTDVVELSTIAHLLAEGARVIATRLNQKELLAGGLRIKLKTSDFQVRTRQLLLTTPSQDFSTFVETALHLLHGVDTHESYRLVGIGAFDLQSLSEGIQITLPLDNLHEEGPYSWIQ